MGVLNQILQFFLSISILIILHELGHYAFARIFKTRVEKFYLFFNPWFEIFKFKRGDTEYGLGWLPLGGYVKISGMIDESMDTKQMQTPPQPYEYRAKPVWQRFLIISGGVLVNFILAIVIYSFVLYTWGEEYLPTKNLTYGVSCEPLAKEMGFEDGDKILLVNGKEVESFTHIVLTIVLENARVVTVEREGKVIDLPISEDFIPHLLKSSMILQPRFPLELGYIAEGSAAEKAGFKLEDKLVAINGQEAKFFDEFRSAMLASKNQTVSVTMERDGELVEILVDVPETSMVGIGPKGLINYFELKRLDYNFIQAIPAGINRGARMISSYLKQLKLVFTPKTKAYESVGGFIAIGSIFPKTWDWQVFWDFTALISIMLAIMNMLPIPALDGGHMLFLVYEMVSGRKPGEKFMEYAQIAGMIFILTLVVVVNANDIIKLFN